MPNVELCKINSVTCQIDDSCSATVEACGRSCHASTRANPECMRQCCDDRCPKTTCTFKPTRSSPSSSRRSEIIAARLEAALRPVSVSFSLYVCRQRSHNELDLTQSIYTEGYMADSTVKLGYFYAGTKKLSVGRRRRSSFERAMWTVATGLAVGGWELLSWSGVRISTGHVWRNGGIDQGRVIGCHYHLNLDLIPMQAWKVIISRELSIVQSTMLPLCSPS